jgi:hypothetical protein
MRFNRAFNCHFSLQTKPWKSELENVPLQMVEE